MESKTILCVDDEQPILRSLKRLLYSTEFNGVFFNNAQDALIYIAQNKVDMIISDIKMPEMDGITLLEKVKVNHPSIIRIFLSGFAENDRILKSIDANIAKLYIFKPWDNEKLVTTIRAIFSLDTEIKHFNLEDKIENLKPIPTLPKVYATIFDKIDNDESVQVLVRDIEKDIALTARILRVANAAYYGSQTKTIAKSIMMIGLNNVRHILLTQSIFAGLEKRDWANLLWDHAILTNKLLHQLYSKIHTKMPAHYASCGLLHTIGLIYLMINDEDDSMYKSLKQDVSLSIYPLIELKYGTSLNNVSSYLLNWWDMPLEIIEAAKCYRLAICENSINPTLIQLLHVASYYAWQSLEAPQFCHELNLKVLQNLNLSTVEMESLINVLPRDAQ